MCQSDEEQALWIPGVVVCLGLNVSSSAHNCGCVVDGGGAMAAICLLLLVIKWKQQ